jgi:hypothetical protein
MTRKRPKFRTLQKRHLRAEQLEDRKMLDASAVLAEAEWSLGIDDAPTGIDPPPVVCDDPGAGTPVSANHGGPVEPDATVFQMVGVRNDTTLNSPAISDEIFAAVANEVEEDADCGGGQTATGFGEYPQAVDAVMARHGADTPLTDTDNAVTNESGLGFILRISAGVDLKRAEDGGTLERNGFLVRMVGVENDHNNSPATGEPVLGQAGGSHLIFPTKPDAHATPSQLNYRGGPFVEFDLADRGRPWP